MEKLVLSLVFTAKRLRRYFQAHPIAVITDQPIKQIISRPDVAGRLQKWSVMLREHNITYRPRTSVKGHILADFLVEKSDDNQPDTSVVETSQELPEGTEFTYALRFQFTASNNEAEYEALIAGLRIAAQMGVRNMHVSVDSKLVANQVLGAYVAKEEYMIKYLEKVKSLPLTPITTPWPFYKWGIDIAGPFPEGPGKVKKFMWDNIVCSFGLPGEIVSDNVRHPQSNGLVERANRSFGDGIKARLGKGNKNWIEELPYVLWAHRTTINSSHGDTPFSLTYGTKAVIPAKIGMPTYRTAAVDAVHNDEELRLNLDLP
ncbi:reverse transcriptase domain-containing protein [Tanacetum coccineum]